MKKLIKKNEFYNGIEVDGDYVEVFINPTQKEVDECKKVDGDIRALLYQDGMLYAWPSQYLHHELETCINLDFNQYHFFTDGSNWCRIHNNSKVLQENEIRNALLNCSCLYNIVNENAELEILNCKLENSDEVEDIDVILCEFLEKQLEDIV